jgi:hypothetical protein
MTRTRIGIIVGAAVAAIAGVALIAGTLAFVSPPGGVAQSDGADSGARLDPNALAKLSPGSRDVALALGPGESAESVLETTNSRLIVALARGHGLAPVASEPGVEIVEVTGPVEQILALVGHPSVSGASLNEVVLAMRPIAAPIADDTTLPVPGRPYVAGFPLNVEPSALGIAHDRREPMLASLAKAIVTIDGQPYQDFEIAAWCHTEAGQERCGFEALGGVTRSGGRSDVWRVTATAANGWSAIGGPEDRPTYSGVPRWLAREAERIARSDPATAAVIATYEWIGGSEWDPDAPGVISVLYGRSCGAHVFRVAFAGRGLLAGTGECLDYLTLRVDVGRKLVVGQATSSTSD